MRKILRDNVNLLGLAMLGAPLILALLIAMFLKAYRPAVGPAFAVLAVLESQAVNHAHEDSPGQTP